MPPRSTALLFVLTAGTLVSGCIPDPTPRLESRLVVSRLAVLGRAADTLFPFDGADAGQAVAIEASQIAVLDYSRSRVVVVDSAGRTVRSFGRPGPGPGEIAHPRFLLRTASGLGIVDDLKHAVIQFTPQGQYQGDTSLYDLVGSPSGILTGVVRLDDSSWAFTVPERTGTSFREALYVRSRGRTRLLATTPMAEGHAVRLPCGIWLSPAPPVLWPTVRWSVAGGRVAYATTAADRVVVWDPTRGDSSVIEGSLTPSQTSENEALSLTPGTRVTTGQKGCALTREEALRQRGFARLRPVIERVTLSPDGAVWLHLVRGDNAGSFLRVHSGTRVDSLAATAVPAFFLDSSTFVAIENDASDGTIVSRWRVSAAPITPPN